MKSCIFRGLDALFSYLHLTPYVQNRILCSNYYGQHNLVHCITKTVFGNYTTLLPEMCTLL